MEKEKLIKLCQEQLSLTPAGAYVPLKQRGRWKKLDYRILCGVKGDIVQEYFDGLVVLYPAQELLNALKKTSGDEK